MLLFVKATCPCQPLTYTKILPDGGGRQCDFHFSVPQQMKLVVIYCTLRNCLTFVHNSTMLMTFSMAFIIWLKNVSLVGVLPIMMYLLQEDPPKDRTSLIKDTNNPAYNATFKLTIHRNSRACQRVFKRHSIKLEVWSRGWVPGVLYIMLSFHWKVFYLFVLCKDFFHFGT